jgi:hypothetical protein
LGIELHRELVAHERLEFRARRGRSVATGFESVYATVGMGVVDRSSGGVC